MDKQEYKILLEEIMSLTEQEQFVEAANIADRINWRKVPSFTVLQKISNLYKINRRYEEALEIIMMAYERNPKSRSVLYSLCELCIENNKIGEALHYLAEYKKIAPREPDAYILQYEILEQQEAPLEDRIELLEELNRKYYKEEWAYQLAYLYHRVGLATKCIETCDQLITWFGDGPFVIKAMELKMLHTKLTSKQQAIYDRRNDYADELEAYEGDEYVEETSETQDLPEISEEDFHVKTIDMSKFNTINLQKELAKNMREIMGDDYDNKPGSVTSKLMQPLVEDEEGGIMNTSSDLASEDDIMKKYRNTKEFEPVREEENSQATSEDYELISENDFTEDAAYYGEDEFVLQEGEEVLYEGEDGRLYYENGELFEEELYYEDGTLYQTGKIVPEEPDSYEEYEDKQSLSAKVDQEFANRSTIVFTKEQQEAVWENAKREQVEESVQDAIRNTARLGKVSEEMPQDNPESIQAALNRQPEDGMATAEYYTEEADAGYSVQPENPEEVGMDFSRPRLRNQSRDMGPVSKTGEIFFEDKTGDIVMDQVPVEVMSDVLAMAPETVSDVSHKGIDIRDVEVEKKPISSSKRSGFEDVLSLEQDGQISLVVPEEDMLEKQITGQMNIEDMLANWESIRQYHEEKQRANRHQSIVDRTGPIFEAFDEQSKNDLLSRLEEEHKASKRVISNDLELKKVEEVENGIEGAQGKIEHISIWDEVDAAMEADKRAAAAGAIVTGAAGVAAAGAKAAGELAGAAVAGGNAVKSAADFAGSLGKTVEAGTAVIEELAAAANMDDTGAVSDIEASFDAGAKQGATDSVEKELENLSAEEIDEDAYIEDAADDFSDEISYEEEPEEEYSNSEEFSDSETAEDITEVTADEEETPYEDTNLPEETGYFKEIAETESAEISGEIAENEEADRAGDEVKEEVSETVSGEENEFYEGANLDTSEINSIGDALEAAADRVEIETVDEINDEYVEDGEEREFTQEEQELFSDFLYSKKMRKQILDAVDMVSLAAYVGNVIVTGESGTGAIELAKSIIKEVQLTDSNFVASKVAKISGSKMNKKDIASMFAQLANGALIIERASDMNKDTLESVTKVLETTQDGILIVMTDNKKAVDKLISEYELITAYFNVRIDITPMSNNALVAYAKKYAYGREYKIDEEKAVLALHQRISELQIGDHNVSPKEIEDIVEDAIEHSKKPRLGTYFSILGGKRYDYEDMIILKEKDFMR